MRAEDISTIDEANAFLPGLVERFNAKFARRPANDKDLHRPLRQSDKQLREILCLKDQRYVGSQLTITYDGKKIILDPDGTAKGLVGKHVDIHQYADGTFSVVYAGEALPHTICDNAQQQVMHTSIVENKRLSAVLRYVKEQQDQMPEPTIKRANRKNGYKKTGKKPGRTPGTPGKKRAEVSA